MIDLNTTIKQRGGGGGTDKGKLFSSSSFYPTSPPYTSCLSSFVNYRNARLWQQQNGQLSMVIVSKKVRSSPIIPFFRYLSLLISVLLLLDHYKWSGGKQTLTMPVAVMEESIDAWPPQIPSCNLWRSDNTDILDTFCLRKKHSCDHITLSDKAV